MDRTIVYPGAVPDDTDILSPQRYAMEAIGMLLQSALGTTVVASGLACTPTTPASLTVNIGQGCIISQQTVDASAFGSLSADTTDPLVKMGINLSTTPFTLSVPTTTGQSINYLIEATFAETDDTPIILSYYNADNPLQPFSGPGNNSTAQNTRRAQRVALQMKAGTPANTGTQATPAVDSGWTGLWVVTVNYGQSAITGTSIAQYANAPFLVPYTASHHSGAPGQAPKIKLDSEVQNVLPMGNLPASDTTGKISAVQVYAGNPNGHVAGNTAVGNVPPSLCWDSTNSILYACVTSGSTASAVWKPSSSKGMAGWRYQVQVPTTGSVTTNTTSFTAPSTGVILASAAANLSFEPQPSGSGLAVVINGVTYGSDNTTGAMTVFGAATIAAGTCTVSAVYTAGSTGGSWSSTGLHVAYIFVPG